MIDPWEVLDRAANINTAIETIIEVAVFGYLVYKSIMKPRTVVRAAPAHLQGRGKLHAVGISVATGGKSSVHGDVQVGRRSPPAWEELLWWYLRARSS
jgi:hypothetical protein